MTSSFNEKKAEYQESVNEVVSGKYHLHSIICIAPY